MPKKVVLVFDDETYENLQMLTEALDHENIGETLVNAIDLYNALREQGDEGFTEIVLRNKKKEMEKIMKLKIKSKNKPNKNHTKK